MIYKAIHHGAKMTAKKVNDRWMVGGDYDTNGALIMMPQTCKTISLITGEVSYSERWAWFELRGAVLKFQDWAGEAEVAEMAAEEADPIKQLDTADEKPVRRKDLERPYRKQTAYSYRGFTIYSQVQGCYSSNPYGSFDGTLFIKGDKAGNGSMKRVSANRLRQIVRQIDQFWDNYKAVS